MNRLSRRFVLALAAAGLAIAGVSHAQAAGAHRPATAAPQAGGTATFLSFAEVPTLDAGRARSSTGGGQIPLVPIYDMLAEVAPDGTVTGRLAESVESEDSLVWTITLREGTVFSDGTPFDADAVVAHWTRIADPETASPAIGEVSKIESWEVVDPLTVRVTLLQPNAQWPRHLMRALGMIPSPTAVAELGDEFASAPVGAGPFMVSEYARDDHLTLVRNPNYWDAPRPYLDSLIFRPVTDDQQRFDTLAAGDAEFSFNVVWNTQLVQSIDDGMDVRIGPNSGGQGLVFNVSEPPLDDVRVRQALYMATDTADLNDKVAGGNAAVVDTMFPEGSPFHNPELTPPASDLAGAQALIDEYVAEVGGPIEVTLLGTEQSRIANETVQQQWNRLEGVEASIDLVETTEFLRRQLAGEFSVAGSAISGVDPEPYMSSFLETGSPLNFGQFSSPEIDAALEAGRVATDLDARIAAYNDFQAAFWEQVPYILTFRLPYATVVGPNVIDFRIIDDGLPDFAAASLAG